MKRNKLLYFTVSSLIEAYKDKFPEVVRMAVVSDTLEQFCRFLRVYVYQLAQSRKTTLPKESSIVSLPLHSAARRIHRMLLLEGKVIRDFASGREIKCESVELLWKALGREETDAGADFMLDWYHLFEQLQAKNCVDYAVDRSEHDRERWLSGMNENVFYERCGNRTLIQQALIEKISNRTSKNSRYRFRPGMTFAEKQDQVRVWWFDYQFQLVMAIRSANELNYFMGMTLSRRTMDILYSAERKGIPFFITPYYLSLLSVKAFGYDDAAIRSYVLYSAELVEEFGQIQAWEKEDCVKPGEPNTAGWLLPDHGSVHRRYPDVAILIPASRGRACGGLCAVCQRMYGFQQGRLNFDLDKLAPHEDWEERLNNLMEYFENDSQLRDILITGGDALMSSNMTLKGLLEAVLRMAHRKREANKKRPGGKKYATIQRIRLGSRMLAYLPYRIDDELLEILGDFHRRAQQVGITQFFLQTHFESPLEITAEVMEAVRKIQECGWIVTNQHVFTVASSRRGHNAALRQMLNRAGILPYYTFSVKGFAENKALAVPNCRLVQEMEEEKKHGILTAEMKDVLQRVVMLPQRMQYDSYRLLTCCQNSFVATDRSVMNLPGIGKSITFTTVGLMPDGRRILRFTLDPERFHSPVVKRIKEIYITENKSVAAYLRQLQQLGEQIEDYGTVWYYNKGKTESVADVFRYPGLEDTITNDFTNLTQY